jgi:hypothetical protein
VSARSNWGGRACPGGANAGTYAPFNFNPYNIFQTPFKRMNIYSQANYEISDAVEIYGRGTVLQQLDRSPSLRHPGSIRRNSADQPE